MLIPSLLAGFNSGLGGFGLGAITLGSLSIAPPPPRVSSCGNLVSRSAVPRSSCACLQAAPEANSRLWFCIAPPGWTQSASSRHAARRSVLWPPLTYLLTVAASRACSAFERPTPPSPTASAADIPATTFIAHRWAQAPSLQAAHLYTKTFVVDDQLNLAVPQLRPTVPHASTTGTAKVRAVTSHRLFLRGEELTSTSLAAGISTKAATPEGREGRSEVREGRREGREGRREGREGRREGAARGACGA